MPPPGTIESGIVLKVFAADGTTKVFVNVCGHDSVGLPLTRSMEPIPNAEFMDYHGIDNLIVPISVGDPVHCQRTSDLDSGKMVIVDVVVHTQVVRRVVPSHPKYEDLLTKVTALALEWVTQETGIQLSKRTVKLLQNTKYKEPPSKKTASAAMDDLDNLGPAEKEKMEANIRKRANDLYEQLLKETGGGQGTTDQAQGETTSNVRIPDAFLTNKKPLQTGGGKGGHPTTAQQPTAAAPTRRPMVVEMPPQGPMLKKGFLNNPTTRLYQDGGSAEGVLPDGAGDPLGYLPKGLRDKVKVIDTRETQKPVPSKPVLPFTAGGAGEVSGAEFLDQLAMLESVSAKRDPKAVEELTAELQRQIEVSRVEETESAAPSGPLATHSSTPPTTHDIEQPPAATQSLHMPPSPSTWTESIAVADDGTITVRLTAPPDVHSMKDIDLNVENDVIEVNAHVVRLPSMIDVDSVKAKFVKTSRTLVVTGVRSVAPS